MMYVPRFVNGHYRLSLRHKKTNSEFNSYIKRINKYSKGVLGTGKVKIGFRNKRPKFVEKSVIGTCNYSISDFKYEVDIYSDYWKVLGKTQKFFLIAHELRHCECKFFKHIKFKFFNDRCPFSFMNSSIPPEICLKRHLNHYLAEITYGCENVTK